MTRNLRTFWSRGGGPSRRPAPNVRLMLLDPFGYTRPVNPR